MDEARYRTAERALWRSVGADPIERWVNLARSGARIRVQELGSGPPVVFLHGGSISGSSWASLVARLPDLRCIIVDRPGCGLSAPLPAGLADVDRLERFADDLVADLFDALSLDRASVAATSFGGYMGIRSAAAHPARIEKLLLFGYPVGAPSEHVPMVMRIGSIPLLGRLMLTVPANERMVRQIFRGIGLRGALESGQISDEMIAWFLSMLRDTDTMRNELTQMPPIISLRRGLNPNVLVPDAVLTRTTVPTYLLWGEADPFGGADAARAFAGRLPNAQLELMAGAGHAVWMDNPDRAAEVTRRFVAT